MIMPRMIFSSIQFRDEKKRVVERMVPKAGRCLFVRRAECQLCQNTIAPRDGRNKGSCPIVMLRGSQPNAPGNTKMRLLIALIVIIYLVGVGVVLSPTIRSTWNTETASALADHVMQALPDALTWPVRAVRAFAGGS
jgi:hypothetical protein